MKELGLTVRGYWQHEAARLLIKLARRLVLPYPVAYERGIARWIIDAYIGAHVLATITEMLLSHPDDSRFYGRQLLEHARQLTKIVEDSRRAEAPAGGNVVAFARKR